MNNIERKIVIEAFNETRQVTLYANYRNFQTWYTLETFVMKAPSVLVDSYTYNRDYYDTDEAFDKVERAIKDYKLTIIDNAA